MENFVASILVHSTRLLKTHASSNVLFIELATIDESYTCQLSPSTYCKPNSIIMNIRECIDYSVLSVTNPKYNP